jgi:hypothetical protein
MSELLPLPQSNEPPKKQRSSAKLFFGILFLLLGALLIVGGIMAQKQMQMLNEALGNERAHIAELESQIKDMEAHPASTPSSAQAAEHSSASSKEDAATIAHLQNDLTAMSAALSALQSEVKATGTIAVQTKQSAQGSVTTLLAFIQLREAVLAGRKFNIELSAMRDAAKNNVPLAAALEKLSPYADTGVTTPTILSDRLISLEAQALQAVSKSEAKTWEDRIIAELKGLISIRPLHGGVGTDFTSIENSLASGDTASAVEASKNLPPDAQKTLEDWRKQADARVAAEQALHDISALVSGQGVP